MNTFFENARNAAIAEYVKFMSLSLGQKIWYIIVAIFKLALLALAAFLAFTIVLRPIGKMIIRKFQSMDFKFKRTN